MGSHFRGHFEKAALLDKFSMFAFIWNKPPFGALVLPFTVFHLKNWGECKKEKKNIVCVSRKNSCKKIFSCQYLKSTDFKVGAPGRFGGHVPRPGALPLFSYAIGYTLCYKMNNLQSVSTPPLLPYPTQRKHRYISLHLSVIIPRVTIFPKFITWNFLFRYINELYRGPNKRDIAFQKCFFNFFFFWFFFCTNKTGLVPLTFFW